MRCYRQPFSPAVGICGPTSPAPENDTCAGAVDLSSKVGEYIFGPFDSGANDYGSNPAACNFFPGPDLAYRFTVPNSSSSFVPFRVTVSPVAGWNYDVAVWAAPQDGEGCIANASCTDQSDTAGPGGAEVLHVSGEPGKTYVIIVDSAYSNASGDPSEQSASWGLFAIRIDLD
jgi:hypothetical protein